MAGQSQPAQGVGEEGSELPQPSHRGLKTAVIVMGILLVVGFITVFSTIIYRAVKLGAEPGSAAAPARLGFGTLAAETAQDAQIGQMSLDGDRLAVELRGPGGREIVIFDVRRGQELGRIRFAPK